MLTHLIVRQRQTKSVVTMKRVISPDELAEGLVVGEGAVVFLSKDVVNVFHAPGLQ